MIEEASAFLSKRRAHMVAASDRALVVLNQPRERLEQQLAQDVVWLLIEVRRLEELVQTCGLPLDYGEHAH